MPRMAVLICMTMHVLKKLKPVDKVMGQTSCMCLHNILLTYGNISPGGLCQQVLLFLCVGFVQASLPISLCSI